MTSAEKADPGSDAGTADEARLTGGRRTSSIVGLIGRLSSRLDLRGAGPGRRALRASIWSTSGYAVSTILRFISRLVLAKLLGVSSPMGDVAIVVTILSGLEMISDLGIGINIVQHPRGGERKFLGVAYSVQALRGVGIWAIASALAWPVALVYHDPELLWLLLFAALSTLLKAFANPGVWALNREVQLRVPTLLSLSSEIVGFVVTVIWAFMAPSAWAIVGGSVATAAIYAAGSQLAPTRVALSWEPQLARQIAHFGGWMILSSGTSFLSSRGEALLLRGSIPDEQFGTFAFATMLVMTPTAAFTQLSTQVFFPSLATSLRAGPDQGLRDYRRAKWIFTGLALAFAWGGMVLGPLIVKLMGLGASFAGLAWMVQLLGLRAALDIYGTTSGTALFACGASRYSSFANAIRLLILVAGLSLILPTWGLPGAFFVLISAPLLGYLGLLPGLRRHMPGAIRLESLSLPVFLLGSLAAAIAGWLVWRGFPV